MFLYFCKDLLELLGDKVRILAVFSWLMIIQLLFLHELSYLGEEIVL